ncbi:MAG TPA: flavodoxin domain-containing protein [Polyangiaceae bacterium]
MQQTMQSSGSSGSSILVAYATAHGSTEGIATAIAGRLLTAGHTVDIRAVDTVEYLDHYDAVVLGSAVHNTAWLAPATAFVARHADELKRRPLWLFSVCSLGETSSFFGPRASRLLRRARGARESKEMTAYRRDLHPRDHRNFAGAVARGHWSRMGDLFLRAFGGTFGDHRDWSDIHAWADGIAREVSLAPRASLAAE